MKKIYFSTGNPEKYLIAKSKCLKENIRLVKLDIDVDEIQGEDPELIVKDKALKVFEVHKNPIVVSDDSWSVFALNGFPGAYMKSMNHWFKAEDFLRLMDGVKDRKVALYQYLAFYDGINMSLFKKVQSGSILNEKKGYNARSPFMEVVSLDYNKGLSLAEVFDQKFNNQVYAKRPDPWDDLIKWHKQMFFNN